MLNDVDTECLKTALIYSAYRGNEQIAKIILDRGISINTAITSDNINDNGKTLLHIATEQGHVNVVKLFIKEYKANVNSISDGFITPLHMAAKSGKCELLKVLLDFGADIERTNCKNLSAFHFAVLTGHEEAVELLLNHGASINEKNIYDETGLSIAIEKSHTQVAKIIIRTLIKMKCEGKFVNENNLVALRNVVQLYSYQLECEKELQLLQDTKFNDSSLSYISILKIEDVNQLAALANNENVIEALKLGEFEKEFPIYGKMIVRKFERGVLRKNLHKKLCKLFNYVACRSSDRLPKLPYTCVYQIFLYLRDLSDQDCEKLLYL